MPRWADLSINGSTATRDKTASATVGGNLAMTGGTLEIELGGLAAGDFDQLAVTGYGQPWAALERHPGGWLDPNTNDAFTIVSGSSVSGSFASVTTDWSWSIVGGNSVVLTYTGSGTVTPHTGDTDNNGTVDIFDYLTLTSNYGVTSGATWAMGDFDNNGNVDIFDYLALTAEYGWSGSGGTNVPEPATMSLLGLGGLALLRRRR